MDKLPIFDISHFYEAYQLYIFDLDNTLYAENDYLFAAYKQIAHYVEQNARTSAVLVERYLKQTYQSYGRNQLFDRMNDYFQLSISVDKYLDILRKVQVNPKFALFPEMEQILRAILDRKKPVYLATNGNRQQQVSKVAAIDWKDLLPHIQIVYCSDIEPKPSPASIVHILEKEKIKNEGAVFVGDSDGDQEAAHKAGVTFIHVSNFLHVKQP